MTQRPADPYRTPDDRDVAGRVADAEIDARGDEANGVAEEAAPAPAPDLEQVEAERDQYLDALQRLKAEFDNYRKRNDRERQTIATGATREVVRGLLPVMDNLERAVAALGDQGVQIVAGLEMVRGQLAGLLAGHGVEEIPADGRAVRSDGARGDRLRAIAGARGGNGHPGDREGVPPGGPCPASHAGRDRLTAQRLRREKG